jgi:hypothetical protein
MQLCSHPFPKAGNVALNYVQLLSLCLEATMCLQQKLGDMQVLLGTAAATLTTLLAEMETQMQHWEQAQNLWQMLLASMPEDHPDRLNMQIKLLMSQTHGHRDIRGIERTVSDIVTNPACQGSDAVHVAQMLFGERSHLRGHQVLAVQCCAMVARTVAKKLGFATYAATFDICR